MINSCHLLPEASEAAPHAHRVTKPHHHASGCGSGGYRTFHCPQQRVEEPRLHHALGTPKTSFFLHGKGKMPSYPWEDGSVHCTISEKTSVRSFIPQIHCSRHRTQQKMTKFSQKIKPLKPKTVSKICIFKN